jgi:UDP-hydrolysing UDP-N-acetyl-D-glucosamine 2-epimerase
MINKRKIAVITTSRADYGHLYWPLKDLLAHPEVDLKLIALGPHLSTEFGHTVDEIEQDGFIIEARIECLLSSDTDIGMAKTIGVATLGLADALGRIRPDILLLIADRYEMLAPAAVALALRIPIAHIEGGEVSEGAIDDAVRNALTKISHLHFTSTEDARLRVLAMGEEDWRVHRVGSASLDHLLRQKLFTCEEMEAALGLSLNQPPIIVTYHPVTLSLDTTFEADPLFAALEQLSQQIIFCYPNADAGSRLLIERIESFCARRGGRAHLFINLPHLKYWSLLKCAALMIGNSSSGIMETPSLALPTVNVGLRQKGRERARNVLDAVADTRDILEKVQLALSPAFSESLEGMTNPYGDGRAAEKITQVLTGVSLGERLLLKRAVPVNNRWQQSMRKQS